MQETNAVVLLERKVRRLRKEYGRIDLVSSVQHQMSGGEWLKKSLVRPVKVGTPPDA